MTVLLLIGAFVLAMLVAGAEAALVAANRLRLEVLARQGSRTARLAQALLDAPATPCRDNRDGAGRPRARP